MTFTACYFSSYSDQEKSLLVLGKSLLLDFFGVLLKPYSPQQNVSLRLLESGILMKAKNINCVKEPTLPHQ